jgi:hypothetical protein
MLEVLERYLNGFSLSGCCVVSQWISTLSEEEQTLLQQLKEKNSDIKIASLYKDLTQSVNLPFKLTAFRSHLRGYCSCQ